MHWRTWATIVSALWSTAVTALPSSEAPDGSSSSIDRPYVDPTLKDPLWLKYGLNASAEYKYFHEPGRDDILGHYDVRFFTTPVSDSKRAETLTHMIRAYLNFFDENDLETWIAHGTLLGWWWNGKVSTRRMTSFGSIPRYSKGESADMRIHVDSPLGLGYGYSSPRYDARLPRRPL
jgi:hypothetical protein